MTQYDKQNQNLDLAHRQENTFNAIIYAQLCSQVRVRTG